MLAPLADALARGATAAAPTFDGHRGHPVLFARELFDRLIAVQGDEGARGVLSGLGAACVLVQTDDPGVLFDIDRPEDLKDGQLP